MGKEAVMGDRGGKMRYCLNEVHESDVCSSACHFSGLWDALLDSRNILRGNMSVCVSTLVSAAVWVCPASLQFIGVGTTPRAIVWCGAGAGSCPWAKSGHTGTGHWKRKQNFNPDQCFLKFMMFIILDILYTSSDLKSYLFF